MVPMPGSSRVVRVAFSDPFFVGVGPEAVGGAGAAEAVAVGDLDGVHPGPVECGHDVADLGGGVAVPDGVHAVPQGHVLDVEVHLLTHPRSSAMRSAVRRAAEVMMSRLPAYSGR
jgi:hypothetical protein